jgi:NAD(P)-dependent dehydrogenase (short-subunit alcohol dehydrogenase family)
MSQTIAIVGASGAIGQALAHAYATQYPTATLQLFSRQPSLDAPPNAQIHPIDYSDEASIAQAAEIAAQDGPLDAVIVATGMLHDGALMPEKTVGGLSMDHLNRVLHVNTVVPALVAKYFLPKLSKTNRSVFAALSARVGSISDNRLGGWYAYRASKAALNMIIKTAAIEMQRVNKQAIVVGLHPGTVDSALSKPFQARVPSDQLFTAKYAAERLINVVETLTPADTGQCWDWQGLPIQP